MSKVVKNFCFDSNEDKEILSFLDSLDNKSKYLRNLISVHMKNNGVESQGETSDTTRQDFLEKYSNISDILVKVADKIEIIENSLIDGVVVKSKKDVVSNTFEDEKTGSKEMDSRDTVSVDDDSNDEVYNSIMESLNFI